MAQDATGTIPETTETVETVEMTDERRDEQASQLVDRFSLWSGAAGLIPIPLVDVAVVGGVQIQMLRKLRKSTACRSPRTWASPCSPAWPAR